MTGRFARKLVLALVVLAVIPLGASLFLLDRVMDSAESLRVGEAEGRRSALERASAAYTELFAVRKLLFKERAHALAERAARAPALDAALLDGELVRDEALRAARLDGGDGVLLFERRSARPSPGEEVRELRVREALPDGRTLELVYVTPRAPFAAFQALGDVTNSELGLRLLHERLGGVFRAVFFAGLALVILVAALLGMLLARQVTRRVLALARATRRVAAGDLEARANLPGDDELADLGRAFDEMVKELRAGRERIAFLEKIGAWQEIARRLAHEIKNPLTPIQLAVQQLETAYVPREPVENDRYASTLRDAASIVAEEIAGLRRLVEEFSAFAKLPRVVPALVDAGGLVEELVRSYGGWEGRVELATPTGPLAVMADKLMVRRALCNLVDNALEAGAKRVWIRVEEQAGAALVVVEDDGPGVPAEMQERVFDPYVTSKEHGTGLGLAIVKKIVLEQGGAVAVGGRAGGGARFSFTLPRATGG